MEENIDKEGAVIVYRETITFTLWVHLFMLAFQIFWIYFFVTLLVQGYPWPSLFFGFFGVFWALMWYNSRHLDFLITTDYIEFGFGIAKKRIKRSEIVSCELYQIRFRNYLGYGVRIGFDKTIADEDYAVYGAAATDTSFDGGSDQVTYQIDVQGHEGPYTVHVELLYQSVSYRFAQDLCQDETASDEIVCEYHRTVDHAPAVVASAQKKVH